MVMSIHEALQIPIMKQTRLIAGLDGLHNIIKWVTVVEVIDDISRLQEGEFLITTGFGLNENHEKRYQFQKLLAMKKLSGLALYSGFYLKEIPESFIRIANENALPLIEIPTHINFSTITKALLEQLVNNQMKLLEYSLNIHQQLTKLTLGNHGLTAITQTLSILINGSVILCNSLYEITHFEINNEHVKLADQETIIIHGHEVSLQPYLIQLTQKVHPVDLFIQDLTIQIYPIVANRVNLGFIITIKESGQWGRMDSVALEHAATVYAIEYLKQRAIEETQLRLQVDFLEEILQQNFKGSPFLLERGEKMGFDLTLNHAVLQIKIKDYHINPKNIMSKEIVNQLYQIAQQVLDKKKKQYMIRNKLDGIILLIEVEESKPKNARQYTNELANEIQNRCSLYFPKSPLIIGIGRNYCDINKFSQSAREAEYALLFSKLLLKPKTIIHYEDLGMYHILIKMKESGIDLQSLYEENLGPLLCLNDKGADLILTLETYLTYNQSIQTTASELFIHRHTLTYRLKQIEKKTGLELDSADNRMKLLLAIMAFKFLRSLEDPLN